MMSTSPSSHKLEFTNLTQLLQHALLIGTDVVGRPLILTNDGRMFIGFAEEDDDTLNVAWEEQDFINA